MSETLTLALVTGATGLIGALIGGWFMMRVERMRLRREGVGITNAIRLDLVTRIGPLERLADGLIRGRLPLTNARLNWVKISIDATTHLPPMLSIMITELYTKLQTTDTDYAIVFGNLDSGEATAQGVAARYRLRKILLFYHAVNERWNRYDKRNLWHRKFARDELNRVEYSAKEQYFQNLNKELDRNMRCKYGYDMTDDGNDLIVVTPEAVARMQTEIDAKRQEWEDARR